MKCNNCDFEFLVMSNNMRCPKCNSLLEFDSISEALKYIFDKYGITVLKKHNEFIGLLRDIVPYFNDDIRLIEIAVKSGVYEQIIFSNINSEPEKEACINKCLSILHETYFLDKNKAIEVIEHLTSYLNWNVNTDIKKIVEVTSEKDTDCYKVEKDNLEDKRKKDIFKRRMVAVGCMCALLFFTVVSVLLLTLQKNNDTTNEIISENTNTFVTNENNDNYNEENTYDDYEEEQKDNRYGISNDIILPDTYCEVDTYSVYGLQEGDDLPVRKGPGTEYEKFTILENGELIDVIGNVEDNEEWVLVYREEYDEYGWVNCNYLVVALDAYNTFEEEQSWFSSVSDGDVLPIRRGPDTSFEKIIGIGRGEAVIVYGSSEDDRWWYVYYEPSDIYGWVNKDYLIESIVPSEITFGEYPQTKVSDEDLIIKLNELSPQWDDWTSYKYLSGEGNNWSDGTGVESDYMKYCDVEYNGELYRGVNFVTYRKVFTNFKSNESIEDSQQDENGYEINNTYWFKWEPLTWVVLDENAGLILCKNVIDSMPFNNNLFGPGGSKGFFRDSECTVYANNYNESSLRMWLNSETNNSGFYNTAFTQDEKNKILHTEISNVAYSSRYSTDNTVDKVFILSIDDIKNDMYWDEDEVAKVAYGTDYAKCQGLNTPKADGASLWITRSGSTYPSLICFINENGDYDTGCDTFNTSAGVRPALCLVNLGKYSN